MLSRIYTIIKRRIKRKLVVAIYRKPKVVRASTLARAQHYVDNHGCPTTRCFPRTTEEAFRHLGETSEWFYPPEQRWQDKVIFGVSVFVWVAISIYFWRS